MVGFVVSKKISKSACRRNKIKRRLREAYRNFRASEKDNGTEKQPLEKWYAMVFVIKENALTATWSEICSTIEKAFLEAARRYG
jgi:ribonuclease P protein component